MQPIIMLIHTNIGRWESKPQLSAPSSATIVIIQQILSVNIYIDRNLVKLLPLPRQLNIGTKY